MFARTPSVEAVKPKRFSNSTAAGALSTSVTDGKARRRVPKVFSPSDMDLLLALIAFETPAPISSGLVRPVFFRSLRCTPANHLTYPRRALDPPAERLK